MIRYESKRNVLVIEDNDLNREILAEILSDNYNVIEAENGKVGLELLQENSGRISLILLDIQMPVMNGYEFLNAVKEEPRFSGIPIIVTTSSDTIMDEVSCLENGASDFVSKPYTADIVLARAASLIRLSETTALLRKVEYDDLTGLYSKEFFFENAARLLDDSPTATFDLICSDIEAFKMVNDRYGVAMGDSVLQYLAHKLRQSFPGALCGRVSGDVFAVLCNGAPFEAYRERVERFVAELEDCPVPNVTVCFGVYCNVSRELAPEVICDNALLAVAGIKHRYGDHIALYDDTVRRRLQREQEIVGHMERALTNHEFKAYFQAKHDLRGDFTGGAEALVRWISPEMGFMSPGEFIPLFERNGFIRRLDFYMLEETCIAQRGWLDAGLPVVPISVNVSRADFAERNLVGKIAELVDKYQLPHDLIHLEVTESLYIQDPDRITQLVGEMKEAGFHVELDDFGSGYSSLNVLTELVPDVIKLDMSIVRNIHEEKRRMVLRCVMAMCEDLGMETVAEGVETLEQVEILREMGCTYAQGYYYSKPLPQAQFETYLKEHAATGTKQ